MVSYCTKCMNSEILKGMKIIFIQHCGYTKARQPKAEFKLLLLLSTSFLQLSIIIWEFSIAYNCSCIGDYSNRRNLQKFFTFWYKKNEGISSAENARHIIFTLQNVWSHSIIRNICRLGQIFTYSMIDFCLPILRVCNTCSCFVDRLGCILYGRMSMIRQGEFLWRKLDPNI